MVRSMIWRMRAGSRLSEAKAFAAARTSAAVNVARAVAASCAASTAAAEGCGRSRLDTRRGCRASSAAELRLGAGCSRRARWRLLPAMPATAPDATAPRTSLPAAPAHRWLGAGLALGRCALARAGGGGRVNLRGRCCSGSDALCVASSVRRLPRPAFFGMVAGGQQVPRGRCGAPDHIWRGLVGLPGPPATGEGGADRDFGGHGGGAAVKWPSRQLWTSGQKGELGGSHHWGAMSLNRLLDQVHQDQI